MAEVQKTVKSFNGTVVGNPTLDLDTGIVSGFSTSNYVQKNLNTLGNVWDIYIKFITPSSTISDGQKILSIGTQNSEYKYALIFINKAGTNIYAKTSNDGSNYILTGVNSSDISNNTTYYIRFGCDGSKSYAYISTTGYDDMTLLEEVNTVSTIPATTLYLGYDPYYTSKGAFAGSIDLLETYINVNGERWWTPIKTGTYYGSAFKVHQTLPYMFGARGVGYYDSVVSKVPTANEDILLTMKAYDGLTETYTAGIGTAGKVDFTGTILPWKWDYNSGLDVSKYCLMPSGLTYDNIDVGDKEPNLLYTETATVSTDNVISNITRGLYTSQRFTFEKEKSFEIFCKVKTGSSVSDIREICTTVDPGTYLFIRVNGSKWNPVLFVNNSVVQGNVGSISTNTVYYVRLKYFPTTQVIDEVTYSAHQAYFETSTDNVTWTRQHTFDLSTYFIGTTSSATSYTFTLDFGAQGENAELWNGEIYLEDCYVKIDDVEVWNGLKPKYISLPGCTYNFTDDGSATTLNAFVVQGDKNIVLTPDVEYYGNRYLGTVEIPQHDVYQYNNGTWQNAPHLIGGNTYYFKMIGGGGGSSTWDGGAGAYWEGYYTPAQTVAVNLSQGGGGSGAGAYSRNHNGVKGGTTSIVGEGVSIVCEGGQGAIGLRNGDETGNSSTYTYAPTITITNGTYETIKASTHNRPRRISWNDDTVTGYGAGGQAASGTKAPGNNGLAGYLEYYQVGTITINPTPADALVEMSLDGIEYTTTNSLKAKVDETVYYRVSKEGYITNDASVLVAGNETINVELTPSTAPVTKQRLVSVADNLDTNKLVLYTDDGINWNTSTMPNSRNWGHPFYGNGKFIVTCYGTNIFAYSEDGINWTESTFPVDSGYMYRGGAYGNGIYLIGYRKLKDGPNRLYKSTNGIDWQLLKPFEGLGGALTNLIFDGEKFVAMFQNEKSVRYSTDGETWTAGGTVPSYASSNVPTTFIYDSVHQLYVIAGSSIPDGNNHAQNQYIYVSSDLNTWTRLNVGNNAYTNVVPTTSCIIDNKIKIFSGSPLISGNYQQSAVYIEISSDGSSATLVGSSVPRLNYSGGANVINNRAVVIGYGSDQYIYSTDGTTWNTGTLPASSGWWGSCVGEV